MTGLARLLAERINGGSFDDPTCYTAEQRDLWRGHAAFVEMAVTLEIERLRGRLEVAETANAGLPTNKRPWADPLAAQTIAIQVKELDRMAARVQAAEAERDEEAAQAHVQYQLVVQLEAERDRLRNSLGRTEAAARELASGCFNWSDDVARELVELKGAVDEARELLGLSRLGELP